MILHQQILHSKDGTPMELWAMDTESGMFARCELHDHDLTIRVRSLPSTLNGVQPIGETNAGKSAQTTIQNILRSLIPVLGTRLRLIGGGMSSILEIPEYLLLNTLDGKTPAIARTVDPVFHCLADTETATLGEIQPADPSAALPVAGWEYWWTDAQQHFDELTEAFLADSGK